MRSVTFTELSAVTVVSALVPTFLPTMTFETPSTLSSAACTFLEHPPPQTRPETLRVMVFSSEATISAVATALVAKGVAVAAAVRNAMAAIMVILVFIVFNGSGVGLPDHLGFRVAQVGGCACDLFALAV